MISSSKSAIRRELRAIRRNLPPAFVRAASSTASAAVRRHAAYQRSHAVVGYLADENEILINELLHEAVTSGKELFLPGTRTPVGVRRWQPGQPLTDGYGGVAEPMSDQHQGLPSPAVALVPVVAWDFNGCRLGRGGGYYDRLLERLGETVYRVGIGYEFQQWPGLPCDSWDVPLHTIITEQRTIECVWPLGGRSGAELRKGGMRV